MFSELPRVCLKIKLLFINIIIRFETKYLTKMLLIPGFKFGKSSRNTCIDNNLLKKNSHLYICETLLTQCSRLISACNSSNIKIYLGYFVALSGSSHIINLLLYMLGI